MTVADHGVGGLMALLGMLVDAPARFHAAHPLDVMPQHEGDLLVVQLRFDVAVG